MEFGITQSFNDLINTLLQTSTNSSEAVGIIVKYMACCAIFYIFIFDYIIVYLVIGTTTPTNLEDQSSSSFHGILIEHS
jgi:hypothetical protein